MVESHAAALRELTRLVKYLQQVRDELHPTHVEHIRVVISQLQALL